MEPLLIAVVIGISVYILCIALIPKRILAEMSDYTRGQLQRLEREATPYSAEDTTSVLREQITRSNIITRVFYTLPGARDIYPMLVKGGLSNHIERFFAVFLTMLLLLIYALKGFGAWGLIAAAVVTYGTAWWYIRRRVRKRNHAFLDNFPDALDMIVRSVRSGYPLNASVRMVAENMLPPVSSEFKQVADETSYGSTLLDALKRLASRIDEPDVRFFVVMLAVQQEVGGNLSEVLSNLAAIIRKRKHLRLKIKALTSEGRATAWVLGALPLVVAAAIRYVAPHHFEPLYTTGLGLMLLAGAVGIYLLGIFLVQQMINMEI